MIVQNQVLFRLPNEEHINSITEDGLGKNEFIVRAFDKRLKTRVLKGEFQIIKFEDLASVLNNWLLPVPHPLVPPMEYRQLVHKAVEAINAGSFEKVVPARSKTVPSNVSLTNLFTKLTLVYPSAFVYAFNLDGKVMIGASPETLLQRNGNVLKTEALGGTRTKGQYTDKENKEHGHIVSYIKGLLEENAYSFKIMDTVRRDAGPVEHLSTGFEMVSNGEKADRNLMEIMHPTPAVCGLPYKEALEFINKYEGIDRGFYSGYIGPVYSNGNFMMFVNLRCAEVFQSYYKVFAGAGVNELSNPEEEYLETENKMRTIVQWLK